MLKKLEEYGKYVEITGFRNVKIENPKQFLNSLNLEVGDNLEVQFFNADLVATWQHLYFAALNALMAFRANRNISKTLAVETALYASAQRQIKKALDLIGIKPTSKNIAVLLISENKESIKLAACAVSKRMDANADETVLYLSKKKNVNIMNVFEISEGELEDSSLGEIDNRLIDSVIERVALLSTRL